MEELVIIGGGAAGLLCAALTSANGIKTTIIEHTGVLGKKILSTGNGKCNMTNMELDTNKYYCEDSAFIKNIIEKFGYQDLICLFEEFGMLTRDKNGYIYPYSEQATAVREILLNQCIANDTTILKDLDVLRIATHNNFFSIELAGREISTKYLLLATGGKSFSKSGSDGSGYQLASNLGHHIRRTVPALTALICHEKYFKQVAGVRVKVQIRLFDGKKTIALDHGELQLTDYGISGIPVFNISRQAAYVLKSCRKPYALIDFMPEYNIEELKCMLLKKCSVGKKRTIYEQLSFLMNRKLALLFIKLSSIKPDKEADRITEDEINKLIQNIKTFKTEIANVKGFDFSQATAGGIVVDEIKDTMESVLHKNLYFAGEIIDVDGICGGYNLHFAWATAFIAAQSIIEKYRRKPNELSSFL